MTLFVFFRIQQNLRDFPDKMPAPAILAFKDMLEYFLWTLNIFFAIRTGAGGCWGSIDGVALCPWMLDILVSDNTFV